MYYGPASVEHREFHLLCAAQNRSCVLKKPDRDRVEQEPDERGRDECIVIRTSVSGVQCDIEYRTGVRSWERSQLLQTKSQRSE